jgi:hypothetical protein
MIRSLIAAIAIILASGAAQALELSSPDIAEGKAMNPEQVGKGSNCAGGNVSPALQWQDAPAGTKSFALTVFDPDAGGGKGFWHWGIYDIAGDATGLAKGAGAADGAALPKGAAQSKSEFGFSGYMGACPPAGPAHHYIFKLMALSVAKLDVPAQPTPQAIDAAAQKVKLGEAKLVPVYAKP